VSRRVAARAERAQVPKLVASADLTRHDVIDLARLPAAADAAEVITLERLEPPSSPTAA
jgi:hypothetical protein